MKKYIALGCLLCIGFIAGMGYTSTKADQNNPVKIWLHNENGTMDTFLVVDENTGVNYIVVRDDYHGGVTMSPRYQPDGSLYYTSYTD